MNLEVVSKPSLGPDPLVYAYRSILKLPSVFQWLNATLRLGFEPRFFIEGFETTSIHPQSQMIVI